MNVSMITLPTCFCAFLIAAVTPTAANNQLRGTNASAATRHLTAHPPSLVGGLFGVAANGELQQRGSASEINAGLPWNVISHVVIEGRFSSQLSQVVVNDGAQNVWTLNVENMLHFKSGTGGNAQFHYPPILEDPPQVPPLDELSPIISGLVAIAVAGKVDVIYGISKWFWGCKPPSIYRRSIRVSSELLMSDDWVEEQLPAGLKSSCKCDLHNIDACNEPGDSPLSIAASADGNHLWATNRNLEIFYKGPSTSWMKHSSSGAMRQIAVSATGAHVWAVGRSRGIWYHAGQYGQSWTRIDASRNYMQVAVSGEGSSDSKVVALDTSGHMYFLSQNGNSYDFQHISAPLMSFIWPYNLPAGTPDPYEFDGEWFRAASNVNNVVLSASITWSTTTQNSVTESFTWGLSQALSTKFKTGFLGAGAETTVTLTASQTWSESVTNTVSRMEGGSRTYSCSSHSCTGQLWQWRLKSTSQTNGAVHDVNTCDFVCVPASTRDEPKCPATFCGDLPGSCACCNEVWVDAEVNPPESPLCNLV